jgi:peptide chain release factor 3
VRRAPGGLDFAHAKCDMPAMNKPLSAGFGADTMDAVSSPLGAEVARRRTFAIISHPDAGKTTLTEKLLLFGGAINLAGQVRAKGERRATRSDWMKIERERGISVVTSVMTFEYGGLVFNLLDTPGHEDFSEDTYRTLTAVDSAVMVIDAAKGIEARTRKLFEVCRLRDIPIVTFINKMDRESRDPFDLLDEIEKTLALDTAPMTWPIGRGRDFIGTLDVDTGMVRLMEGTSAGKGRGAGTGALPATARQMDAAAIAALNPNLDAAALEEEFALVRDGCAKFNLAAFREGHLTPVYFGSALKNFGVRDLLDGFGAFAPPPRAQTADARVVAAEEPAMTAFVFKIQANMDPNHRDRIAFARLCSGRLERGMKVRHVRSGKTIGLHAPHFFFAQDRAIADEAYAGDVVGIPNHGSLRIGDTLTEGEVLNFVGVPSFAPEILRRVRLTDAMKAKKLRQALQEMAEEGVVQVFRPTDGSPPLIGVVGALQLDVLRERLASEYGLPVEFDVSEFALARWIASADRAALEKFAEANRSGIAEDLDGDLVYLARSAFYLDYTRERAPGIAFTDVKDVKTARAA